MKFGKIRYHFSRFLNPPLDPGKGYDLWADIYDSKETNLVFMLEDKILDSLLKETDLSGKVLLDFGCGTGRNWQRLLNKKPREIIGCDISRRMLEQLRVKFPDSKTYRMNRLSELPFRPESFDFIFSTLVVGHIKTLEPVFESWYNWLRPMGSVLVTDLHPQILASGGKRTFQKGKKTYEIQNFVHSLDQLKNLCSRFDFRVIDVNEEYLSEELKEFYESKNALHIYNRFFGLPLVYGMLIRK